MWYVFWNFLIILRWFFYFSINQTIYSPQNFCRRKVPPSNRSSFIMLISRKWNLWIICVKGSVYPGLHHHISHPSNNNLSHHSPSYKHLYLDGKEYLKSKGSHCLGSKCREVYCKENTVKKHRINPHRMIIPRGWKMLRAANILI